MHAIQGDVSSTESIQAVAATIEKNHGYINLLVNNAGIALNTNPQPLRTTPTENEPAPEGATPHPGIRELQAQLLGAGTRADWATTFDINVTGSHYTTLAFMALLEAGNRSPWGLRGVTSQVIFVASVAAFRRDSMQFTFSYALSKSAVVHMAKSFTNILSGWKIRSNVLAPGVYPSGKSFCYCYQSFWFRSKWLIRV
jgi:NAD(P)-dependent dehydrogenase (short-subunit alcohol dehydrogenase family)